MPNYLVNDKLEDDYADRLLVLALKEEEETLECVLMFHLDFDILLYVKRLPIASLSTF
jgi:hypothetical protein